MSGQKQSQGTAVVSPHLLALPSLFWKPGPKGSLPVDEYSRTNVPSIWAIGDVSGWLEWS